MSEEQAKGPKPGLGDRIESVFENFLWGFRLIIVLGVIGLLISSAVVFFLGIIDTVDMTIDIVDGDLRKEVLESEKAAKAAKEASVASGAGALSDTKIHVNAKEKFFEVVIVRVIRTVDFFLLGTVLLIFSLGTYDLFISRIDPAEEQDDIRPDWLVFGSLDELKSVLGKVVLMILTINFLKYATKITYGDALSLLYLGAGIALVSLALKFTHGHDIDSTHFPKSGEKKGDKEQAKA